VDEADVSSARLRRLLLIAGGLLLILAWVWWPGFREYPAVTSKESLYLMKLLYTATNTRDQVQLGKVEQGVQQASREGKLTPKEQEAFAKIIGTAKKGDWQAATKAAFKFAQDQVGQGKRGAQNL
jgi:hypothetical protein